MSLLIILVYLKLFIILKYKKLLIIFFNNTFKKNANNRYETHTKFNQSYCVYSGSHTLIYWYISQLIIH